MALVTTLTMLRPETATFRPVWTAMLTICWMRWILEEKVAMIIRRSPAFWKRFSKVAPTFCSLSEKPGRSALVESASRQRTPWLPYSANRAISMGVSSIGV